MKKILAILFLILSFNFCKAQNPTQDPLIPYIHSGNAGVDSAIIEVYMPGRKGTNNKHFYKMPIDSLPSILIRLGMSGGTVVQSVTDNGSGVVVDNTDPLNPIVEADTTGILATKYYVDSHELTGVDSVWRKAGVDSIFWKKNGVTYAFKDSTAAFSPDSVTAHAWGLHGNAGTNPSTDFIGTTDATALVFKTNDTLAMTISGLNQFVKIGKGAAPSRLSVGGGIFQEYVYSNSPLMYLQYSTDPLQMLTDMDGNTFNGYLIYDGGLFGVKRQHVIFGSGLDLYSQGILFNRTYDLDDSLLIADWTLNTETGKVTITGADLDTYTEYGNSAVLELNSTTAGFLPPRMTGDEAYAIGTKAEGLMIYATEADTISGTIDEPGWYGWDGTDWVKLWRP